MTRLNPRYFIGNLVSYFLPQVSLSKIEEVIFLRKARFLLILGLLSFASCLIIPLFSILVIGLFDITDVVTLFVAALFIVNCFLFKKSGNLKRANQVFHISSMAILTFICLVSGGITSCAIVFAVIWPISVIITMDVKAGIIISTYWLLACILFAIFSSSLEAIRIVPVDINQQMFFITIPIAILYMASLSSSYELLILEYIYKSHKLVTDLESTQNNLLESTEKAEAANKAKSEFLANMSHEIRTPLNGVIGLAGLVLDTDLNEQQKDMVSTIRSSGNSLLTIINEILDFSKIEADKVELEQYAFDLRDCIEGSIELIGPKAGEKNLEILFDMPLSMNTKVIGDPTRLRQILTNLLSNAVKFTFKGHIHLCVASLEGNMYQIKVKDTGNGIPAHKMDKLFRSFEQVDSSITRKYGGTGLGLPISLKLAKLMGGGISVESELGQGSIFTLNIKLEPDPQAIFLEPSLSSQSFAQGDSVMVVSGNHALGKHLSIQLEALGLEVSTSTSSESALASMGDGSHLKAVLVDRYLPGLDAYSFARAMRNKEKLKTISLVLLTHMNDANAKDERAKLFHTVIYKPLLLPKLIQGLDGLALKKKEEKPGQEAKAQSSWDISNQLPLKILMAEDNMVNQMVATRMLAKLGYRIDVAGNGKEAIEALKRQHYDLVLMDIQMPEMDGMSATEHIRKNFPPADQPLIMAMTANAMVGDREKYLAVGMDAYISKPVSLENLKASILRVCAKHIKTQDQEV
ncbi:MAG: response regulator [Bacteroidota bacterium]